MFGGNDAFREPLVIEVDEFIAVKSAKARGKRLTTYQIDEVIELEPTRQPQLSVVEDDDEEQLTDGETFVQSSLFDINDEE